MLQTDIKELQEQTWLGRKGYTLGIAKRLKFDHANTWYMHKPESVQEYESN